MSVILLSRRVAANVLSRLEFGMIGCLAGMLFLAVSLSGAEASTSPTQKSEDLVSFFGTMRPATPQQDQQPAVSPRWHRRSYVRQAVAVPAQTAGVANVTSGSSAVLAEAERYVGRGNVTGTHRAWCADFANMVLKRTGHRASSSGMVNSLLSVGPRVSSPSPGDIVVMRSHVTIFAGFGGKGFYGLGGNQHARVAMSNFPLRSVVAYVHPN